MLWFNPTQHLLLLSIIHVIATTDGWILNRTSISCIGIHLRYSRNTDQNTYVMKIKYHEYFQINMNDWKFETKNVMGLEFLWYALPVDLCISSMFPVHMRLHIFQLCLHSILISSTDRRKHTVQVNTPLPYTQHWTIEENTCKHKENKKTQKNSENISTEPWNLHMNKSRSDVLRKHWQIHQQNIFIYWYYVSKSHFFEKRLYSYYNEDNLMNMLENQ